MQQTKERFFTFISKLEDRLREFAEAAIPELVEINNTDTDEHKREYLRMKSAVLGQIETIRKKADEVMENNIINATFPSSGYYELRSQCYDKKSQLDDLCRQYAAKIESAGNEDYEIKYQKIVEEYENIKDKFRCTQCGSPIFIDKIYFTTTYITCPSCGTQNTFEPSSQAKMLEHLGRSLAEQRTKHLLRQSEELPQKERELYFQQHQLKLSLSRESDKKIIAQKNAEIEELEKQRQELLQQQPVLYQKYLRAMFDEWNKINPSLKEEHERFYISLLNKQFFYPKQNFYE